MAAKHAQPYASSDVPPGEVTPDEIRERAAQVRATWDERTEHNRRVWHGRVEYDVPWIGVEMIDRSATVNGHG